MPTDEENDKTTERVAGYAIGLAANMNHTVRNLRDDETYAFTPDEKVIVGIALTQYTLSLRDAEEYKNQVCVLYRNGLDPSVCLL